MNHKKYEFLDGVRGIAAIFVLTRHTVAYWQIEFFRSYLAVDLFFVLSGFVIAFAYDEKIRSGAMPFKKFFTIRLIRLYPVFLLSVFITGTLLLVKNLILHNPDSPTLSQIGMMVLSSSFFLPLYLPGVAALFPINGVFWSLFFELLANFIYAAIRPLISSNILVVMILASTVALVFSSFSHGSLDVGYTWGLLEILGGFSRSIFGIFTGLLLYMHRNMLLSMLRFKLSPWLALAIISIILASPSYGQLDWVIDLLIVVLVFPILVLYLANGETTKFQKPLLILGAASYPIYVLHGSIAQAINFVFKGWIEKTAPLSGLILVGVLIILSVLIEKIYDLPIRRRLSKKLVK